MFADDHLRCGVQDSAHEVCTATVFEGAESVSPQVEGHVELGSYPAGFEQASKPKRAGEDRTLEFEKVAPADHDDPLC